MSKPSNRAPRNTQQFFKTGAPDERAAGGRRQPDAKRADPAGGPRRGKPFAAAEAPVAGRKPATGGRSRPAGKGAAHPADEWSGKPPSRGQRPDGSAPSTGRRPVAGSPVVVEGQGEGAPRRRPRVIEAGAPQGAPFEPHQPKQQVQKARKLRERAGSLKEQKRADDLRDRRVDPKDLEDMRLQKILALTGLGSRREMEELISAGRVEINFKVAELGQKVSYGDKVRVDGKNVSLKWPDRLPRVILYHKQEGELVSRDDPDGRVTVFDRLPAVKSSKWVAIGRLDFNTSGLLMFTTSGELANNMMHPRFEVEREYAVRVLGELTPEQMKESTKGITLDDGEAHFNRIVDQGGEGRNHWYRVILKEGRNREVRRMFEHFGLTVSRLIRVRFGPVDLPGRLKRGHWLELEPQDVQKLLKWAGMSR